MLESDRIAGRRYDRRGFTDVRRLRRRVQHLEEPLGSRNGKLELHRELGDGLYGRDEAHGHRDERDEHCRAERARAEYHVGADPHQHDSDDGRQGLRDRTRRLAEGVGPHHSTGVLIRPAAETLALVLLGPEGLHEPDPAHGLLGDGQELSPLLERLGVGALQAPEDRAEEHRDQRTRHECDQRELPGKEQEESNVGQGRDVAGRRSGRT